MATGEKFPGLAAALDRLGMSSLKEYHASDMWKERRALYVHCTCPECGVCGTMTTQQQVDLHHITYANLGSEPDSDLIFLCRQCHGDVHKLVNLYCVPLMHAHHVLRLGRDRENWRIKCGLDWMVNRREFAFRNGRRAVWIEDGAGKKLVDTFGVEKCHEALDFLRECGSAAGSAADVLGEELEKYQEEVGAQHSGD